MFDSMPITAKFETTWHYASGDRGVLGWASTTFLAARSVLRAAAMRCAPETVSNLGVLCGTTLLAACRLGESNVVLFERPVHDGSANL